MPARARGLGLPPVLLFVLRFVALNVVLFTAWRALFWAVFHGEGAPLAASAAASAFLLGFRFDLRLAILLALPLWLAAYFRRPGRLERAYAAGMAVLFGLFYTADLAHFEWLARRIEATLLEQLHHPITAFGAVWQTAPGALVIWLAGIGAFGWAYLKLADRWAFPALDRPGEKRGPALHAAAAVLALLIYWGRLSVEPLVWSDAYVSAHPFGSALALNPVLHFFRTLSTLQAPPDPALARRAYPVVADLLDLKARDEGSLSFARPLVPRRAARKKPNVVLIVLESFAAWQTGTFGNPLQPTPRFDGLAKQGTLFRSYYSANNRTIKSVFSIVTGIPDVDPSGPAFNNALLPPQPSLLNAFEGYEKLFFYTGSLSWFDLRAGLARSIPGVRLFGKEDYGSRSMTVWGVSDRDLFREANDVLSDSTKKPFFAVLLTSGNHAPYSFPRELEGFEMRGHNDKTARAAGFKLGEAVDAVRFLDDCLGRFFDEARKEPWFKDTLFVVVGDHGMTMSGESAEERLGLTFHHVPLLFYSPKLLPKPAELDRVASAVDILPTVAALAGVKGTNETLGRDVLKAPKEELAYLHELGVLTRDHLLAEGPDRKYRLYRYRSAEPARDVSASEPERAARMFEQYAALYHTSRSLMQRGAGQASRRMVSSTPAP